MNLSEEKLWRLSISDLKAASGYITEKMELAERMGRCYEYDNLLEQREKVDKVLKEKISL